MQKIAPLYYSVSTQIEYRKLLGIGSQSEVIHVQNQRGEEYVVKRLLPQWSDHEHMQEQLLQEGRHLSLISHSAIPKCMEIVDNGKQIMLLLEWISGSSLRRSIRFHKQNQTWFSPLQIKQWLSELAQTLMICHRDINDEWGRPLHLIHGDLSPHNLIISVQDKSLKIIDWSSSLNGESPEYLKSLCTGKTSYLSPLRQEGHDPTQACDWYSLGIIGFELVVGKRPRFEFLNLPLKVKIKNLTKQGWPHSWAIWVSHLLSEYPEDRLEAVYHQRYFQTLESL